MSVPLSGTVALTQFSQQATAALANVSINFAIWKYDAPKEYQPLRNVLTVKRKEAAEDGPFHTTACKLGALFAPLIPKTPRLSEAYGRRASDIALSWVKSEGGSAHHGAFAEHAGLDGTTILAAATSGQAAIAVHLLACMLAQQLRADKATAAWEELVAERKSQLVAEALHSVPIDTLMAARAEITVQELAKWDASARAWLRVANSIESRRQKQLMLILDNVEGVVRTLATTYDTITAAWSEALLVMERTISGTAHTVQNGSLLLAMSSWHIYPDLTCLGHTTTNIAFNDPVVALGGVLTVGILEDSPQASRAGVHWSLSLSRLRYYGDTQTTESVMNIDTSNLTFEDFSIVTLGAVAYHWTPSQTSLDKACEFFIFLDQFVRKECSTLTYSWTNVFCRVAQRVVSLDGPDRSFAARLFKLGQRNADLFESETGCRLFDYEPDARSGTMQLFTKLCNEGRSKADMLRLAINSGFSRHKDSLCIVVKTRDKDEYTLELADCGTIVRPHVIYLKTFLPNINDDRILQEEISNSLPDDRERKAGGYLIPLVTSEFANAKQNLTRFVWVDPPPPLLGTQYATAHQRTAARGVDLHDVNGRVPVNFKYRVFQQVYGDRTAAIFAERWWRLSVPKNVWDLDDIRLALQKGTLQSVRLIDRMQKHFNSLRTFAAVYDALREMPQMTVSLADVFSSSFEARTWAVERIRSWEDAAKTQSQHSYLEDCFSIPKMTTAQVFASIASLSAGIHNLGANQLTHVMAMSFQDSLFVVKALLEDPYYTSDQVVRIPGNIGRPGLALLIPPTNPKIRPSDPSRWTAINHFDYDGTVEDHFGSTEMSLWFTDYEHPVQQLGISGEKFVQAYFLESVISVYDSGRWIADVDVVSNKHSMYRYGQTDRPMTTSASILRSEERQVISLDNWDEVLASREPETKVVARASKNWLARLALATIAQQKGEKVVVLAPECLIALDSVVDSLTGPHDHDDITTRFGDMLVASKQPFFFIQ